MAWSSMEMRFTLLLIVGSGMFLSAAPTRSQPLISPAWIQHAWANESGFSVRPYAISVHHDGVYVTGHADFNRAGVTFGGDQVDATDSYAFVVSYDLSGKQHWVRAGAFTTAPPTFEVLLGGFSLAVDEGGIVTSEGYGYLFDADMFTSGGVSINRYATDGTHLWTTTIHVPVEDLGDQPGFILGLGLDQTGNIYVTGQYRDTLIMAPDVLAPFPVESSQFIPSDVFLASFTADGDLRWSRRIGGPGVDAIAERIDPRGAFAVDAEGNTYLGGFFSGGAMFGEGQAGEIVLSRDAAALVSYDAMGMLRWVITERDLGISGDFAGPGRLAVDASGNLFVSWGVFGQNNATTVTVGNTTFTDPGHGGEFLTKIAPDGRLLWARQIESDGNEITDELAVDARGHLYVAGFFDGRYLRLEDTVLRKQDLVADGDDAFVAHYDAEGRLLWVGHAAGPETNHINSIAVSPEGDLFVAGEFREILYLGAETLEGRSGGMDMFVAKYAAATITANEDHATMPLSALEASAFPNPFRDRVTIRYEIRSSGHVRLVVYDLLGRVVRTLVDGVQQAGRHEVVFEAEDLSSGLYHFRVSAADAVTGGTVFHVRQ